MIKGKEIFSGFSVRDKIRSGINKLADAVSVTMGPRGRNVIIHRTHSTPIVTKDGVSVAREISLVDPVEDMGAQLCKQAASRTNDMAGDGTTTATVLAAAIVNEGIDKLNDGANPLLIKKGIEKAKDVVISYLDKNKSLLSYSDLSNITNLASISANDKTIGTEVANAYSKVGEDGIVSMQLQKAIGITTEFSNGIRFENGLLNPAFVTNTARNTTEYVDPVILVWDGRIVGSMTKQFHSFLELCYKNGRPLLIIAESVEGTALETLLMNSPFYNPSSPFLCCPVHGPHFGEKRTAFMKDIAIATGAEYFNGETTTLDKVSLMHLGKASNVIVDKYSTTIVGADATNPKLTSHLADLKAQMENAVGSDLTELRERLAFISSSIAIIKLGASTESELREKRDRLEDSIHATKCALQDGILPGGGLALFKASAILDKIKVETADEQIGIDIMKAALRSPIMTILSNGAYDVDSILENLSGLPLKSTKGFNALTGKYENLLKSGVIDPFKVTKSALENAVSIGGLFLTTEVAITEIHETPEK